MEYEILFWLILAALTLVIIAVLGIIYVILQGERNKSKAIERTVIAVAPECPHFFGYLSKQPKNKPIPEECFGCQLGIGCKRAVPMEVTIKKKRK